MILKISLLLVLLVIAYMSLTPTVSISIGNDKVGHLLAYTALMTNVGLLTLKRKFLFRLGIGCSFIYGVLMEIGQCFVPGRTFSIYDILANAGGVIIGLIFTVLFGSSILKLLKAVRII